MLAKEILNDIDYSITPFHAIERVCDYLNKDGFKRINENDSWKNILGGKYYTVRNQSSIAAFKIPENNCMAQGFRITSSHCDSPVFKVKEIPEIAGKYYIQLNTECYGGGIYSTWLDRPLGAAGRVVVYNKEKKCIESKLVKLNEEFVIPNVAIHFNREINDGFKYNLQTDMVPLWSSAAGKDSYKSSIAKLIDVEEKDILSSDIYVYNPQKSIQWGNEKEFMSASRIDDLSCVFTCLRGFLDSDENGIQVYAVFDNEEVGSRTIQGADSDFLYSVLRRITDSISKTELLDDEFYRMLSMSYMISADNAHAVHPNHPEKTDVENNVFMNEGIVIKFNANQHYTSDAVTAGVLKHILNEAEVPFQVFANKSDTRGGSTLGNISASHVSVKTVDIGMAQLAMHSSYETAGSRDCEYMVKGIKAFYSAQIPSII